MAAKTTYICDRCGGQKVDDSDFLHTVSVEVDWGYRPEWREYDRKTLKKAEWCPQCLAAFGLAKEKVNRPQSPVPEATIEDYIRQIVRQEVGGAGS